MGDESRGPLVKNLSVDLGWDAAFLRESLEIARSCQGLSLALSHTYSDGWQIVVDLEDDLPAFFDKRMLGIHGDY